MTKIMPFNGTMYNKKLIKKLSSVITPPYDVITKEAQDNYYIRHPYNMIRLILGNDYPGDTDLNNKYSRAAGFLNAWIKNQILVKDDDQSIYAYEQKFIYKNKSISRLGFIALFKIEEFETGKIYPHENTLSQPKLTRLELIRACAANLEPIFSLYIDEKNKILKSIKSTIKRKPLLEVKDEKKMLHRVWKISGKAAVNKIIKEMSNSQVYIADGHHRYEASLKYRNEMRSRAQKSTGEEPFNFIMMYFTNILEKGLLILPIHRLIQTLSLKEIIGLLSGLQEYFDVIEMKFTEKNENPMRKKLFKLMSQEKDGEHIFGMYINGFNKYYLLKLKNEKIADKLIDHNKPKEWRKLNVTILHSVILKNLLKIPDNKIEETLTFIHDDEEALDLVKHGKYKLALLLNPTKVEQIIAIANKFEKMPQKSTFFYPKLASGLIIYKMEYPEKMTFQL